MNMSQLKGALFYYGVNMRYILFIFWGVLLGIIFLNIVTNLIIGMEGQNIYFSFGVPIYFFAAVMGFWIVRNVFPYLIKMGITRMNIYIGTGIVLIGLVLLNGIIANVLPLLVSSIPESNLESAFEITVDGHTTTGMGALIEQFAENTWWNRFVFDVSLEFFLVTVSFLFGLIFYRYQLIGGFTILGILLLIISYSISSGWFEDFIFDIASGFSMFFFYKLFLTGLLIYLLSHLLIRKLTV